jgi:hypothetical protein
VVYERYRTWYPDIYTVVGVTVTGLNKFLLQAPFLTDLKKKP